MKMKIMKGRIIQINKIINVVGRVCHKSGLSKIIKGMGD